MFDIVHTLTGDDSYPPSLDSRVEQYVQKLRFELEEVVWQSHYVDSARAGDFLSCYDAMTEPVTLHFLLSPSVYETLMAVKNMSLREHIDHLATLAENELGTTRGGPWREDDDRHEIWSPMGDHVLRRTDGVWTRWSAPRLDAMAVLDFESPYARAIDLKSPMMSRPAEPFEEDERAVAVEKFERAFAYIDETSPTFGRLIRNYTRAVRMRKCDAMASFASEHVTSTIGEIRILNAHKPDYSWTRIVEALIHESTHNLLSSYESVKTPFTLVPETRRYRPVSPWTGNPIPIPSFCHAVFVWYALFNFSLREMERPDLTSEARGVVLRRRNRYASGFMVPIPLSRYIDGLTVFNQNILGTIDEVQQTVRRLMRDQRPVEEAEYAEETALVGSLA